MQEQLAKHFFISYTKADVFWAQWIAWELKENGYQKTFALWDFRPGEDFMKKIDEALQKADSMLAVLSPDYLDGMYTRAEWSAFFEKNSAKDNSRIVPVRVRECKPKGLLSTIIYIDLVGLPEKEARRTLLDGLRPEGAPSVRPTFPGPFVFPPMLSPVWNIPHNRNLKFRGRESFLASLSKALTSKRPRTTAQAIVGQAGVGKTEIVIEYAYLHAVDYEVVWWLRAEALASDYVSLARELKLPEKEISDQNVVVKSVQEWLGQNAKWLLIFDNAQHPAELDNYLPHVDTGHVLITSRNPNWQGVANVLPVGVLGGDDAANFLLTRTE